MHNVFMKKSAEELYIQLSNGRMIPLENLSKEYESLLSEDTSKKAATPKQKDDELTTAKMKVGKWFRIDREVINKSRDEIRRKCDKAGTKGKELWKRFEESNKIADENPNQYPRLIETYIFKHDWKSKTEQEMRDMCEKVGAGMCCEIICDLELQMRICNGEPVEDLVIKGDKLPRTRVIKLRNGGNGYFGGGTYYVNNNPPAELLKYFYPFNPEGLDNSKYTPYAFRRVLL